MLANKRVRNGDAVRGFIVSAPMSNDADRHDAAIAMRNGMDEGKRMEFNPPLQTEFGYVVHSAMISRDAYEAFVKQTGAVPVEGEEVDAQICMSGNRVQPLIWTTRLRPSPGGTATDIAA